MIPKIVHYCWFGRSPKPQSVLNFIQTWKDKMPDYEIKEWNEDVFDVSSYKFTKEAYALKKYAFVSDVARLYALYTIGGIYLDTDIEVVKSFTPLLNNKSFIGWEDNRPGTGVLASVPGANWLKEFLDLYEHLDFINIFGGLNDIPNTYKLCDLLKSYGLKLNHKYDLLKDDIAIYPIDYLCAHNLEENKYLISENTYCIHHYSGSWCRKKTFMQKISNRLFNIIIKIKCK